MDQRGGGIALALIGSATAVAWWWALVACRVWAPWPMVVPSMAMAAATATYLCVPETDHMKGVALLLVGMFAIEAVAAEALPAGWHGLMFAVVLWAGLWGGHWRDSAVVGAVFAGWVLVLPALVARSRRTVTRRRRLMVIAVAAAGTGVVARTGALANSLRPALMWTVAVTVASGVTALALVRVGRPRPRRP